MDHKKLDPEFYAQVKDIIDRYVVTSGYRDPIHNIRVGGSPRSMHLEGRAIDVLHRDWQELYDIVKNAILADVNTIIIYKNHVHLDNRERTNPILKCLS